MYLHPAVVHDLTAARLAESARRAAPHRRAHVHHLRGRIPRPARDRPGPALRLRMLRLP
jgi:hypothetical protein